MLVPNVIIIWTGTNASIPTNFSRETDLDGRYPKAPTTATNPGSTGGASSHTHSSSSHSHALNSHTHTGATTQVGLNGQTNVVTNQQQEGLNYAHSHTYTTSTTTGGQTGATAVTYGSVSNDPPYHEVIYIKSTGYNFVPSNATVLWNSSTVPTGFGFHDGSSATPDLRNKYLKGAGTGQDAGATGGSTSNVHDISHTHSTTTHTHTATSSQTSEFDPATRGIYVEFTPTFTLVNKYHTHTITLDAGTQSIDSFSGTLATTETVEPGYKKLMAIKNTSGGNKIAKGIIALWGGTLATIPIGWNLCDGSKGTPDMREKYLKVAASSGELGTTGGANSHTHASQSHTHTSSSSHTHTGSVSDHVAAYRVGGSGGSALQTSPSTLNHTLASISSTTSSYVSSTTSADSSSNEPLYKEYAYIQYDFSVGGASLAFLM